MDLSTQERFALSMIFQDANPVSPAVRDGIDSCVVLAREFTGPGFSATIRFARPFPSGLARWAGDWIFEHRRLDYGGVFDAWLDQGDDHVLELEAVTFGSADWPRYFDPTDFSASESTFEIRAG